MAECGQLPKSVVDALASALVKDADGNVTINFELFQTNCSELSAFIDCNNNHLSPDTLLDSAIGSDACGIPTIKISIPPLAVPNMTELSDVSGIPTINGQFYSWDVANGRFELRNEYDDLPPVPIINAKLGSTAPTLAAFMGTIEQYTFDATNDYIIGATEITHGWAEGTVLQPHIHWVTNGSDGTARGVQWQLKYTVSDHDEVFIGEQTIAVDATIPANTTDRTHYISAFAPTINGANLKIGAYIIWRLQRVATAHINGGPAADPFGIAVGFHALFNSRGSETNSTK